MSTTVGLTVLERVPQPVGESVRLETMVPDLLREHPRTRVVLDRYGLRGCGGPQGPSESLGFFARVHGVDASALLRELDEVIAGGEPRTEGDACCPSCASKVEARAPRPAVADTLYRRFFVTGITMVLTAGATWGAWLLWRIAMGGSFEVNGLQHVNAHGMVQISGWVGLFIMGFAYQAFPRIWHTSLVAPRLAVVVFGAMVGGIIAQAVGMIGTGSGGWAVPVALAGGLVQLAAVTAFAGQIVATFRRGELRFEPYVGFVMSALGWFVLAAGMNAWHTWTTMTAANESTLIWYVATYQAPLRDLQVHGLALFMILGVSLRMLPALFGVPAIPDRRAWTCLALLLGAVVGEVAVLLAHRWMGNPRIAMGLMVPWIMLAVGVGGIVVPWKLWRPLPIADPRSGKFVRAAYGWLAVSIVMLLLLPVYQAASGMSFSHAYYGAIRHAITVGFVSMMIMGFAARVVPTLTGADTVSLTRLWGPFLLVNTGCLLRVTTQTLTDWSTLPYAVIGISGTLEVIGLAWWGTGLVRLIVRAKAVEATDASRASAPSRIEGRHRPAEVLAWFPETATVFDRFGFTPLRQPALRVTLGRSVTLAQASRMHGVEVAELVDALNAARTHAS